MPIQIFKRFGLKAYETPAMSISPIHFDTHVSWFSEQRIDATIAINGNTMVYVYLSRPDMRKEAPGVEWQHRLLPEQIVSYTAYTGKVVNLYEELKCEPGIEFVMGLSAQTHNAFTKTNDGDNVIEIHSCHSSALIHKHQNRWAYIVLPSSEKGTDPFGYITDPNVPYDIQQAVQTGKYLTKREWMEGTKDGDYPIGPILAEDILSMPQSGDLILTSKFHFDFAKDYEWFVGNYRGGHGGIHRNQTVVPFIMSGWGIKPGTEVDAGTTADMGATVRHIAGLPELKHTAGDIIYDIVDNDLHTKH